MNPALNPYSPGAGRIPAALIGRDLERSRWRVGLERLEAGRSAQPFALYGLRGVGKTVLLTDFAREAARRGWIVARIEAGTGKSLREALGEALHGPLSDLARPSAGARLLKGLKTALSLKASYDAQGAWNFGVDLTESAGGGADTGVLETDLTKVIRDISAAAEEEGVGLAILIDEAQDLERSELAALCSIAQLSGGDGWHAQFALAGLPSLPRILAEAKSYAERLFVYEPIEHLDESLTRAAITQPAELEGVSWSPKAVDLAAQHTSGYPYFIQQFGQDIWNVAETDAITLIDARIGAERARAALDNGFYRARWDRATKSEQRYLQAMSPDGDRGSLSGAVADRLGKAATSFGPVRANLISKGLVYAPDHGVVAFTVPGMADFISRQILEDERS